MDLLTEIALLRTRCAALLVRSTALRARACIWEEQTAQLVPAPVMGPVSSVRIERQHTEIAYWVDMFAAIQV